MKPLSKLQVAFFFLEKVGRWGRGNRDKKGTTLDCGVISR